MDGQSTALTIVIPSPSYTPTLDQLVMAWLDEKSGLSDSEDTERSYTAYITQFRALLHKAGLDLDSDPRMISMLAQGWAGTAHRKEKIAAATYNHRISTLSSFYEYAIAHEYLEKNPMRLIPKRKGDAKDYAHPLEQEDVLAYLQKIDRSTISGLRDYAILSVAVMTGRRSKELVSLRMGDIQFAGDKMIITWQRCKGAKVMSDILMPKTARAVMTYLLAVYSTVEGLPPDAPVWFSFARNKSRGKAIGKQTMSDICKKWFKTSKVHTTRHTFSINLETAGAKLSDIGARLGHNSLATTSVYMQRLHSAENPFAAKLEELFFGKEEENHESIKSTGNMS